jgi:hypothetical protein
MVSIPISAGLTIQSFSIRVTALKSNIGIPEIALKKQFRPRHRPHALRHWMMMSESQSKQFAL